MRFTGSGQSRSDRSPDITATTHTTPARRATALIVAVTAAMLALGTPATSEARTAEELFADGNRLFRDDLYWAALLRYRQAADAGMNSALLHYNTGVAHYKAGQYDRARFELEAAAKSARLEVVAHYNLGLNAWAAGANEEALSWFRLARDQQQNPQISKLATTAISARAARHHRGTTDDRACDTAAAGKTPDLATRFSCPRLRRQRFERVPSADRALTSTWLTRVCRSSTPVVQSGFFVPVSLSAQIFDQQLRQ